MMTGDRGVAPAQLGYFSPLVVDRSLFLGSGSLMILLLAFTVSFFALRFCHLDAVDCEAKSLLQFYPFPNN